MKEKLDELLDKKADEYGDGVPNMIGLGKVWTWYMKRKGYFNQGQELKADDVCLMMVLFKISREAGKKKSDMENYIDSHGYLRLAENFIKQMEGK